MADGTETSQPTVAADTKETKADSMADQKGKPGGKHQKEQNRKRQRDGHNHNKPLQHGARNKGRDMGRGEYNQSQLDRRGRNEAEKAKRRKMESTGASTAENVYPAPFSNEEIAAEERRPKKKVAVLIGYSGSGYKGMQIMPNELTIEGDLFKAFVAAGAISKANADDPKKSTLVRCARTDKGVHAAGNVVSLKLIVEDEDIVSKINSHLSPQIRVWGIERTTGSFSCYQACDSRWYEYLLPTHTLLPPHPHSFLGKKLVELAKEANDIEGYHSRQEEVNQFWEVAEEKYIRPILDELREEMRKKVEKALYDIETEAEANGEDKLEVLTEVENSANVGGAEELDVLPADKVESSTDMKGNAEGQTATRKARRAPDSETQELRDTIKRLKSAYLAARLEYRVTPARLARLQEALSAYVGTHNFHNFTVRKAAKDPSCKRHIKSFNVNPTPIVKNGIEWLSLKVHGQSFMMHQIRKMVGLAALVTRCGCPTSRIGEITTEAVASIPTAPSLGLLLERPVFDSYNVNQASKFERNPIEFTKYEKEMQDFKDREIYENMFKVEEEEGVYSTFFAHLDGYREPFFLYLSSGGLKAAGDARKARTARGSKLLDGDSDDEKVQGGEDG